MVWGSLILVALLVVGGAMLKRAFVRAVPVGLDFIPVHPEQYPALDVAMLDRYTWQYSALGFVPVGDYCLGAEQGTVQPGFARVFVHPTEACYAEVNQLFPAMQVPTPMRSMIGTLFEQGWSLATTDRAPDGVAYMLRRPRSLWACRPEMAPSQLFGLHREMRDRLAADVGVAPLAATSRDAYFEHERAEAYERLATVRRKNIFVALAEIMLFPYRPRYEWLGEYRPSVPVLEGASSRG